MRSQAVSTWLQIGSNVGVILGLVFVGVQIEQDRELMRAELTMSVWSEEAEYYRVVLGENLADVLTKVRANESLTPVDITVATAWFKSFASDWTRNLLLEEQGIFEGSWRERFRVSEDFESDFGFRFLSEIAEDPYPNWPDDFISQIRSEVERIHKLRSKEEGI
jgi:hypothetical protein